MKANRTFSLDLEVCIQLEKIINKSELINNFLINYFKIPKESSNEKDIENKIILKKAELADLETIKQKKIKEEADGYSKVIKI